MNLALLKAAIRRHEGESLKLYKDSKGIATIGVGRNLEAKGIRRNELELMFEGDATEAVMDSGLLPCWLKISDVRQRVLANMCFQMGFGKVLAFKKMFEAINRGDFNAAADEMLDSKWAREDSPARAQELAQMMRTDQDPPL